MAHTRLMLRGCHSSDSFRSLNIPRHVEEASFCIKLELISSVFHYFSSFLIQNPSEGHGMTKVPGCQVTSETKLSELSSKTGAVQSVKSKIHFLLLQKNKETDERTTDVKIS